MIAKCQFTIQLKTSETKLLAFARKLTRSHSDAQDLYQETVMKAFLKRDQYNEQDKFHSWITAIMYNTFVSQYKRNKRRAELLSVNSDQCILCRTNYSMLAEEKIYYGEIKTIIKSLGKTSGETLLMYANGFKYEEISEHFQIPIGTVKSRINFARKKLHQTMQTLGVEEMSTAA